MESAVNPLMFYTRNGILFLKIVPLISRIFSLFLIVNMIFF